MVFSAYKFFFSFHPWFEFSESFLCFFIRAQLESIPIGLDLNDKINTSCSKINLSYYFISTNLSHLRVKYV